MQEEENYVSEQNIPQAEILEDVAAYLKAQGDVTPEEGVRRIEVMYEKYKKMEEQMYAQKLRLAAKLPDLEKSSEMIDFLEEKANAKESFKVTNLLSEQVYQQVEADPPEKVLLWLGSNVMVEFSLDEARNILRNNHKNASDAVVKFERELNFIKDQITTTEVNMAHVYNYGVRLKSGTD